MANLQIMNLVPAVAIGALSAGGEIVEQNRQAVGGAENIFLDNAGLIADLVGGVYGVANSMMNLGFPRNGATEGLGAGVAVLSRRLTSVVGRQVLGLTSTTQKSAGRYLGPGRKSSALNAAPYAALEADPRSRKRQFFSVT